MTAAPLSRKLCDATVIVAGLGYLVDFYDLYLFNVVRVKSLTEIGLSGDALTQAGFFVANVQLTGLILGACLWGIVADRMGRKPGLFASILLYSIGSLACAFVHNVEAYAAARFITAIGLAGELGAGVALISEKLSADRRGPGVMIFITLGFVGMLVAAFGVEVMYWRNMYLMGGVAGLFLLLARAALTESGMYAQAKGKKIVYGGFSLLLKNRKNLISYLCSIGMMLPPVFCAQVFWTLSPEIGKAMGIAEPVKANITLAVCYISIMVGDFAVCYLSERLKSRRKAVLLFLAGGALALGWILVSKPATTEAFYAANILLGLFTSFWVVGAVWVAEQFGTNIRATATTTVPNFARAGAIPMNLAFAQLKAVSPLFAATVIGSTVFILALFCASRLKDTYSRDLNFVESA